MENSHTSEPGSSQLSKANSPGVRSFCTTRTVYQAAARMHGAPARSVHRISRLQAQCSENKGFFEGEGKTVTTASAMPGFMLLNGSLQPIAFNSEAVQILAYPTRPDRIQHVTVFLNDKIRSSLLKQKNGCEVAFVKEYRSGGRQYICRAFHVHCPVQEDALCSTALLLERHCSSETDMRDLLLQFDLTPREQETVTLLIEGLTSKEIANRMNISPNTVKAFLRLVMVKMDVSTRSGIVGKIVGPHS